MEHSWPVFSFPPLFLFLFLFFSLASSSRRPVSLSLPFLSPTSLFFPAASPTQPPLTATPVSLSPPRGSALAATLLAVHPRSPSPHLISLFSAAFHRRSSPDQLPLPSLLLPSSPPPLQLPWCCSCRPKPPPSLFLAASPTQPPLTATPVSLSPPYGSALAAALLAVHPPSPSPHLISLFSAAFHHRSSPDQLPLPSLLLPSSPPPSQLPWHYSYCPKPLPSLFPCSSSSLQLPPRTPSSATSPGLQHPPCYPSLSLSLPFSAPHDRSSPDHSFPSPPLLCTASLGCSCHAKPQLRSSLPPSLCFVPLSLSDHRPKLLLCLSNSLPY